MARTTLVIGGTRNVGPDLVAALLARGDRVTMLNRGVTNGPAPDAVERLRADRTDAAALAAALAGREFELVIDTTLYTGADARSVVSLLEGRAGRYVFWSTGQVYLVRVGLARPFREEQYDGPVMDEPPAARTVDHDNWVYGVEKRAAEDQLRDAFLARGFPYVSLRMPMINSPRDSYGRLAAYVRTLARGEPILVPDDQDGLVLRHVSGGDVVAATLRSGEACIPLGTCVNISQDETVRLEEMLAIVAEAIGAQVRIERRPRSRLDAEGLLPACSPWSGRWMSSLDNARSKAVLGIRYTPLREYLPPLARAARAGLR